MNNILVLYPIEFMSFEKFSRKILKITQNLNDINFLCPADHNQFVKKLCNEYLPNAIHTEKTDWTTEDITHAIVFDDGEEFPDDMVLLKKNNIPFRVIKIKITRVINIKKDSRYKNIKSTPKYEYIGRGSYWGNPYSMYENGESRDEVIRKYKYDFDHDLFPNKKKSEVYKLAGKRLGCFCNPEACHGDILANFLNSIDDGK